MPVIHVNAHGARPLPAHGDDLCKTLKSALYATEIDAPVTVMVHGFKYTPFEPARSPHNHIFSLTPDQSRAKSVSWPRHLGFDHGTEGLCIGFGWDASGHIWRAYNQAADAGRALADLTHRLRALRPGVRINVVAHSLGARVMFCALPDMAPGALHRAILMTPAELSSRAAPALATPAGQTAQFLSVNSRENDLFDFMLESVMAPLRPSERSVGQNAPAHANWHDLQIDHADTLHTLDQLGHRIAPPLRRICHWSTYLRAGLFPLYRAVLDGSLPLNTLPAHTSPRWSRLLAPPRVTINLPFVGKTAS
ncbi:hypothetical protein ATO10_00865 [Actibacterium atlanticum]|uniref:AB hydrolase-1 domain-containing protein n=1 Tax=Actibacterium atlanticum TaxID=1461693 RepID=A0A058ZP06_9RHOB|nr:alpha/beta hydrolase [Actibacterium atlanticum]KCV83268.1 hypothetical protein ATO10_00865 [Actibacterium atlanticum]